jgi:hypothetical protein
VDRLSGYDRTSDPDAGKGNEWRLFEPAGVLDERATRCETAAVLGLEQ